MKPLDAKLSDCPECKATGTFYVLESRNIPNGKRRRRCCSSCGYRESFYEISEAAYKDLKDSQMRLGQVIRALQGKVDGILLDATNDEACIVCDKCIHCVDAKCSLGLPEFDSLEANDCTYFNIL